MSELDWMFEDGEYGFRRGMSPRVWHGDFVTAREVSIAGHAGGRHVFNLFAGTGSGKTVAAAMAASNDLNSGRVRRVTVVVPSLVIAANTIEVFRDGFGIHLAAFDGRSHKDGVTSNWQGYVTTYAAVARAASRHRRISKLERTLVIFDEVHHLGEGESWGDAAQLAFSVCPYVLAMSGSPIRPRNGFIPFARYVPTDRPDVLRYAADFRYPLGRAIVEGYCREPDFRVCDDVTVRIKRPWSDVEEVVGFRDEVSDEDADRRLAAAVDFSSVARRTFLANSLSEIGAADRKTIIFLGGDTADSKTPTEDATELLPGQLSELGYASDEIVVVTQRDRNAHAKIQKFRRSPRAKILVTVNMVSEGADIPELSAAIFLTTWTSDLSFIQRVGRVLRYRGKGDHPDAWIYFFHHPRYAANAIDIREEIKAEAAILKKRQQETVPSPGGTPPRKTEAMAIGGGEITYAIWNGEKHPAHLFYPALKILSDKGISKAFLNDVIEHLKKERGRGDCLDV